ncbi:MAG TPA: class I SAM-dependent methyltransferase [Thermoanaerobaculia bacterium]|jgi:ubiquinone/menaquinone biosynthesis C-methylase UbiE|nr:class I SAM-dependent methyltransferase [Thermoanaerobaculia bacterium]
MTDRPSAASAVFRALLVWVLMALGIACSQPLPADGKAVSKREPANVMSFESAAWLEREGREELEKPEVVLQAMELRKGMNVAEIGAGTGFFSRRLAKAVGPTGKVYAEDIQPEMLDLLKQYAAKEGIKNIIPVLGTETDPKLPLGKIDRVLLVDVYHEFQKPEPMLAALRKVLAPGGTITLVEYRLEGDTASHINIKHRMSVEQVLAEWNASGYELANQIETLPSQHVFIFSTRRGARAT